MSKASQGIKLIKWLANQADDVVASADDLKRFGPQAARVRSLLDFLPKMSDDAVHVSNVARYRGDHFANIAAYIDAQDAAQLVSGRPQHFNAAGEAAQDAAVGLARKSRWADGGEDAYNIGSAESVGDLITSKNYRILTNPVNLGREADIVNMNAPENFMGILRDLTERSLIVNPQDVRSARKLADLTDYERDPVMEYINTLIENDYDGYRYPGSAYKSLKQMIEAARVM